jgi:hypothetical protein
MVIDREAPICLLVVRILLIVVIFLGICSLTRGNLAGLPGLFDLLENLLLGLSGFIIIFVIGAALLFDKFFIIGFLFLVQYDINMDNISVNFQEFILDVIQVHSL